MCDMVGIHQDKRRWTSRPYRHDVRRRSTICVASTIVPGGRLPFVMDMFHGCPGERRG
jgi:hypothetical protein